MSRIDLVQENERQSDYEMAMENRPGSLVMKRIISSGEDRFDEESPTIENRAIKSTLYRVSGVVQSVGDGKKFRKVSYMGISREPVMQDEMVTVNGNRYQLGMVEKVGPSMWRFQVFSID